MGVNRESIDIVLYIFFRALVNLHIQAESQGHLFDIALSSDRDRVWFLV